LFHVKRFRQAVDIIAIPTVFLVLETTGQEKKLFLAVPVLAQIPLWNKLSYGSHHFAFSDPGPSLFLLRVSIPCAQSMSERLSLAR
jgi:hypothetical protein